MTSSSRSSSRRQTYRAWVEEGARGFFLAPAVAVNAVRLINPLDRRGGYFVRRDTSDAQQRERRALLKIADHEDGERDDRFGRASRVERAESRHAQHRTVIAYDNVPTANDPSAELAGGAAGGAAGEAWVVTARVERAAEVVRRGWLGWETEGEVVMPARSEKNSAKGEQA
ncbi:MAG TPA: hypothetical protein VID72_14025 [Ktedonobacterales bacterium]|jgi:hypothetical protein